MGTSDRIAEMDRDFLRRFAVIAVGWLAVFFGAAVALLLLEEQLSGIFF